MVSITHISDGRQHMWISAQRQMSCASGGNRGDRPARGLMNSRLSGRQRSIKGKRAGHGPRRRRLLPSRRCPALSQRATRSRSARLPLTLPKATGSIEAVVRTKSPGKTVWRWRPSTGVSVALLTIPGIWSSPQREDESDGLVPAHPDRRQHRARGKAQSGNTGCRDGGANSHSPSVFACAVPGNFRLPRYHFIRMRELSR